MLLRRAITQALGGASVSQLYSADLYTGDGLDRTITTGIDNASGSLVWIKERTSTSGHRWFDTGRGATKAIESSSTAAEITETLGVTAFNSDGYDLGGDTDTNQAGQDYVSWSFLKAEKFLDIITYTGDGVAGREIPHNLGVQAGLCVAKALSSTGGWSVQHVARGGTKFMQLNATSAESTNTAWNNVTMDDTKVTLGNLSGGANDSGKTYVMYVFAHDVDASGIIQCGGYTGTGVTDNKITLGWKPQLILIKSATVGGTSWVMLDTARGINTGADDPRIYANDTAAEVLNTNWVELDSDGFRIKPTFGQVNSAGEEYIYMAIREE